MTMGKNIVALTTHQQHIVEWLEELPNAGLVHIDAHLQIINGLQRGKVTIAGGPTIKSTNNFPCENCHYDKPYDEYISSQFTWRNGRFCGASVRGRGRNLSAAVACEYVERRIKKAPTTK